MRTSWLTTCHRSLRKSGEERTPAAFVLQPTWEVTAFYKRESQEKTLPLRLEGAGASARSPAYVMLGGSGFFFLQIHRDRDDALGSDANKQGGGQVPTMVLSETRGL
jgi:hypothetical protein